MFKRMKRLFGPTAKQEIVATADCIETEYPSFRANPEYNGTSAERLYEIVEGICVSRCLSGI